MRTWSTWTSVSFLGRRGRADQREIRCVGRKNLTGDSVVRNYTVAPAGSPSIAAGHLPAGSLHCASRYGGVASGLGE